MRQKIYGIPLLAVILASVLPLAAFAVYTIITLTGEVTVDEAITVSPVSFTAAIYPGEAYTETLTLNNASSVSIDVSFVSSISPMTLEVTVSTPNKVTVPAAGSTTANISMAASKSAPPGVYTISIGLTR